MKNTINQKITIGVDTGKCQLDIHIHPLDEYFTVENNNSGIKQAIKTLKSYSPERIVIEATGCLERAFIQACAKAKLPFFVTNPIHIKRFAGAIGQRAKTDKLDAKLIALFGATIKPALCTLKPDTMQKLNDAPFSTGLLFQADR